MKTRVVGVLAASACAVGMMGAPAFAGTGHHGQGGGRGGHNNIGNINVLSGNNINIPITIPIDICGNAIAVLGFAEAGCQGGAGVFVNSPSGW